MAFGVNQSTTLWPLAISSYHETHVSQVSLPSGRTHWKNDIYVDTESSSPCPRFFFSLSLSFHRYDSFSEPTMVWDRTMSLNSLCNEELLLLKNDIESYLLKPESLSPPPSLLHQFPVLWPSRCPLKLKSVFFFSLRNASCDIPSECPGLCIQESLAFKMHELGRYLQGNGHAKAICVWMQTKLHIIMGKVAKHAALFQVKATQKQKVTLWLPFTKYRTITFIVHGSMKLL